MQVQSLFTYWSANSLPMRKDGIFRAVPNSAAQVRSCRFCRFCSHSPATCLTRRPHCRLVGLDAGAITRQCRRRGDLTAVMHCLETKADAALPVPLLPGLPQEGDKVVAQFGAWSAIVSVGGELFQASADARCSVASAAGCALAQARWCNPGPGRFHAVHKVARLRNFTQRQHRHAA